MEYLDSTLIVFAILIAVAVAAVSFQPANPLEKWHRLVERYGATGRPPEAPFTNVPVRFGGTRGGLHPLNKFVAFDVAIDDFGLWLICRGPDDSDNVSIIKVPGTHVRPSGRRGRKHLFDLYAEPPVRISVPSEVGSAIIDKAQAANNPVSE